MVMQEEMSLLNQNQNCENVNNMELKSFQDAYVERCDKETENVIAVEDPNFLNEKIWGNFLKKILKRKKVRRKIIIKKL